MRTDHISMLESLRRIRAFLADHRAKFDANAQKALQRLANLVTSLVTYAATQSGGEILSKDLTRQQEEQRAALIRDHMGAIAAIARTDLSDAPELPDLRLPRLRLRGQRLATVAHKMADAAKLHASVFVAAGMPEDFVDQLTAAADALMATVSEREATRSLAAGSAQALKERIAEARNVVRILDRYATKALQDDPDLLAQWKRIKRIPRVPRVLASGTTASTPSTPTSTPPTTPSATPATPSAPALASSAAAPAAATAPSAPSLTLAA